MEVLLRFFVSPGLFKTIYLEILYIRSMPKFLPTRTDVCIHALV